MINSSTVIVVGAGASKEVGLPTGKKLKNKIASMLNIEFDDFDQITSEYEIIKALRHHVRLPESESSDIDPYIEACSHICNAMPQATSIDTFIDQQDDKKIELCGKLAIVRSILEAEGESPLYIEPQQAWPTPNFNKLEETWYNRFTQILFEGCRKEDIKNRFKNISFISFNYDRCIEHYLFHTLQNCYRIDADESADALRALNIFHPYGTVGHLPWQKLNGATSFGESLDGERLLSCANQIKTFTEQIKDKIEIAKMRHVLQDAERILFLGFAFHRQNMELIRPEKPGRASNVFATAHGISTSGLEVVEKQISDLIRPDPGAIKINLGHELTCNGLFKEYWRSLIFS